MKNLFIRRFLVSGFAFLITVALVLAQTIPDEIDFKKYEGIYLSYRTQSEQRRAEANALMQQAQAIDQQAAGVAQQISANEQEVQRLQGLIQYRQGQVQDLHRVNDQLGQERNQLINRIQWNNHELGKLSHQLSQLSSQLEVLQSRKQQLEAKLGQLDHRIQEIDQQLGVKQNQLQSLQTQKQQLEQALAGLQQQRQSLAQQIQQRESRLPQLQNEISQLEGQLPTLQALVANLTNQVNAKQGQLQTLQARQSQVQGEVNQAQTSLGQLNGSLNQTRNQLQAEVTQKQKLQQLLAETEKKYADAKAKGQEDLAKQLAAEMSRLKNAIQGQDQKIAQLKTTQATLEGQVAQQQKILQKAQGELANLNTQVTTAKNELDSLKSQLNHASTQHQQVQTQLQAKRAERDQINSQLPGLRTQLAQVQTQIQSKSQQLSQVNQGIPGLQQEVQALQQQRANWVAKRNPVAADLAEVTQSHHQTQKVYNQKFAEYRNIENDNRQCENRIKEVDYQVTANLGTIQTYQSEMQNAYGSIQQYEAINVSLRTQLASLQAQAQSAWASYQSADQVAKQAEMLTQSSYEKYAAVKAHYDGLYAAAWQAGSQQGDSFGKQEGHVAGAQVGESSGQSEGLTFGEREAGLASYEAGLGQGLFDGQKQGYDRGFKAPQNYQRGYDLGYSAGLKQAKDEAQRTSYIQGRSDKKKELLSVLPTKVVDLEKDLRPESGPRGIMSQEIEGSSSVGHYELTQGLNPISVGALEVEDPDLKIKKLISLTQAERNQLAKTLAQLRGNKVYPGSIPVNPNQAQCSQTYVDFVNACRSGFEDQYKKSFSAQYGDSYLDARNRSFDLSFADTLKKSKDSRLQEGFDEAYPIVFAKWEAQGAVDAENKGFSDGQVKGYQENLAAEKTAAYSRGQVDEGQYFATKSVVRVLSVSVEPQDPFKGFIPGAPLVLKLLAANYGKQPSSLGEVQLTVTTSSGSVGFEKHTTQLVSIPAESQARVHRVILGQVSHEAPWNEVVTVRVRATYGDGFAEEKTTTVKTQFNLNVATKVDGDRRPDIKNVFGYHNHTVKVTVTNNSKNVGQRAFKVVAVVPSEFPDVKFYKADADAGVLNRGESKTIELKYEIRNKNYKDKVIPLEFIVLYDGATEVSREKLVIQPTN